MSYTTATFIRLDSNADGSSSIVLLFTGNAGEAPKEVVYPIDTTVMPTADTMRALAMARIAKLNNNLNFYAGALPAVNTVLDTTTPLPAPPASTFGAFVAVSAAFTPGATPQDVFTITGSAARLVTVQKFSIATVQTTAGVNGWSVVKRSTANIGGTSTAVTRVALNRLFPTATATVLQYSANPATAGTLVGPVWAGRVAAPTPTALPTFDTEKLVLNGSMTQPITLSGITDVLAWNFGGVALPAGLSVQASVVWTET